MREEHRTMKLSVAIADDHAGPSAFVVWRGFPESMKKAARCGYRGVELALRSREDVDARELRALLGRYDLQVSCISTGQVFSDLKLYLTSPDKQVRENCVKVLGGLVDLAQEFGGMVNLGRARGFVGEGQTREEAEALFLEGLERIGERAQKRDVTIVVEPVNRYESNFLNSVQESGEFFRKHPLPAIGLMADVFHMNLEDVSIEKSLAEHMGLIKYVHLADSNRLAPGWGHTDFSKIFSALKKGSYEGWVSVEILPKPNPDSAARQAAKHLIPMIAMYNNDVH